MASEKIDPKVVEDYISNHGDECPFCGSDDIEIEDGFREYNTEAGTKAEREMWCAACKESWTEVFILTDIKPM